MRVAGGSATSGSSRTGLSALREQRQHRDDGRRPQDLPAMYQSQR
jgi:hypothetical protein